MEGLPSVPSAAPAPDVAAVVAVPKPTPEEAYARYAALLKRIAMRRYDVPPADADCLVQDVFASYIISSDRPIGDVKAYLAVAICRASQRYWHRRRGEAPMLDEEAPAAAFDDPDMRILTLRIDLATTVARLRPRCRELFGRIVAGESAEAIAAAMCMSGNNLRVTLHDCRRKAREIYARLTNRNATPR